MVFIRNLNLIIIQSWTYLHFWVSAPNYLVVVVQFIVTDITMLFSGKLQVIDQLLVFLKARSVGK